MTLLQLHSDALAVPVDEERVQLRSPDGQHLTFNADAELLVAAFERLSMGVGRPELDMLLGDALADELLTLLRSRGLLADFDGPKPAQFQQLLAQYKAGGGAVLDALPPRGIEIAGEGRIAALARAAVPATAARPAAANETLIVATADREDWDTLLKMNARAVAERRTITFARWDQRRLLIGPFVVPGETACLECVAHRQRAASLHPDELLAWRRDGARQPAFRGGPGLDAFVKAAIEHHLAAILAGAYDLARPGAISILDPITFHTTVASVMRLPRCPTCRPSSETVARSIRDLN